MCGSGLIALTTPCAFALPVEDVQKGPQTDPVVDIMNASSEALSLNEFTNTVTGSVTVQSTRHPEHGDDGQYFFFDRQHWGTVFGSDLDNVLTFVVQRRGTTVVWRGVVVTWSNSNGVHGRRFSGNANSQWRVGDQLLRPGRGESVVVVQRDCCTRNDPGNSRRGSGSIWGNGKVHLAHVGEKVLCNLVTG